MYAVVKTGGKQVEAKPGAVIKVEKLSGEVGDAVILDRVLLFSDGGEIQVGRPYVDGVSVKGRIVEQGRRQKIIVFRYIRRKDSHKKQGHRQGFTAVRIESIGA